MTTGKDPSYMTQKFTRDETERIRATFKAAGPLEGYASLEDLAKAGILREVRRLERKHNGGKKWPGIPAGELRPGRRTRDETAHRKEP
ncbi:hypothetical protein ABH924_003733 [Arthrobacter sp. GAS37]|uniref:ParB family protein n=1 Tax=Arthrobacter sp. GAS37 TaxID=3156261 RepID=UPI0038344079